MERISSKNSDSISHLVGSIALFTIDPIYNHFKIEFYSEFYRVKLSYK